MNRRNFLQLAALAMAGEAAERVFPFRVYSIPKKIVIASHPENSHFLYQMNIDMAAAWESIGITVTPNGIWCDDLDLEWSPISPDLSGASLRPAPIE